MQSLKSLRDKMRSVESTQKITQAMNMIAASAFHKAKLRLENARSYGIGIESIVQKILNQRSAECESKIILVFTSDKGLCGSFNATICKFAIDFIANCKAKRIKILGIGEKGKKIANNQIESNFIQNVKFATMDFAADVWRLLMEDVMKDNASCSIIYTHFTSSIKQNVISKDLPTFKDFLNKDSDLEFEPPYSSFIKSLYVNYVIAIIFNALAEHSVSEYSARMVAMDTATSNAKSLLKEMQRKYNSTRQAIITRELIEVITGAEAYNH
ncbi:MAG: ATP synthase F1 subunit gamma [Proteobacteria bacterium]|nr:ATP synthase F1 subunit gamma [Pseudomonadota bacterium]